MLSPFLYPIIILSGFLKSLTADPSLKNSGLLISDKFLNFLKYLLYKYSVVPGGIVLLRTIKIFFFPLYDFKI